jgi:DNA-directed RNA polymerase subunit H (RpoH/RPB5)
MSDINIIIGSLIAVGVALFSVSYINSMQTRKRLINQRLHQLKRDVSELEEIASSVGPLVGSTNIEKIILEDCLDTLKGMVQLAPENQSTILNVESVLSRLDEINAGATQIPLHRILESDAQIARARYQLGEAGRIVRKRQTAGFLELQEMNALIEELAWAHLMVHVVTLTAQGHKAISKGDVLRAYSFYKKAQEAAMAAKLGDDRKHKIIKELNEMQANRRKALSIDLMPETQFNPQVDTITPATQNEAPAPPNSDPSNSTHSKNDTEQ